MSDPRRIMITFEKVKELLGVTDLPGDPREIEEMLQATDELIQQHGEQWIRDNRSRLVWEWEWMLGSG
jgi:hypothetical protein